MRVTSPLAAPVAAMLAAVAAVVAAGARRPPLVRSLAPRGRDVRPPLVERLGGLRPVRRLVAAERLAALLRPAGWSVAPERLAGSAFVSAGIPALALAALGWPTVAVAPVVWLAAARAPVLAARRAASARLRAVERGVPLLLDVLSLASHAGLPPQSALHRAVSVLDGPLATELSAALDDVDLGARWRDRLREVAEDVPLPEIAGTIALLTRSETMGTGFAEAISIMADEVRASRRAHATERARAAPVKMLFPLVFLVLPAFLLLTVVPVLVATLGSIR